MTPHYLYLVNESLSFSELQNSIFRLVLHFGQIKICELKNHPILQKYERNLVDQCIEQMVNTNHYFMFAHSKFLETMHDNQNDVKNPIKIEKIDNEDRFICINEKILNKLLMLDTLTQISCICFYL